MPLRFPSQFVDVLRGVSGFFTDAWVCSLKRVAPPLDGAARSPVSVANIMAAIAAVGAGACLAERTGVNRMLTLRPLLWLGQVSYSIHMMHHAIDWVVRHFMHVMTAISAGPARSPTVTPPCHPRDGRLPIPDAHDPR